MEAALAKWAHNQRSARQNGILSEERACTLEHLVGWTRQPLEGQWESLVPVGAGLVPRTPCSPEERHYPIPDEQEAAGERA